MGARRIICPLCAVCSSSHAFLCFTGMFFSPFAANGLSLVLLLVFCITNCSEYHNGVSPLFFFPTLLISYLYNAGSARSLIILKTPNTTQQFRPAQIRSSTTTSHILRSRCRFIKKASMLCCTSYTILHISTRMLIALIGHLQSSR
jgi:hypothetical protein